MSKKTKILLILIGILLVISVGLLMIVFFNKKETPLQTKEVMEQIEGYNYTLDSLDSTLFKNEFNELKKILNESEINYEDYAKSIAKLFAIDLYSISTKINRSDVGGTEYIYSTKQELYKAKIMDTMYKEVKDNSSKNRVQELPLVNNVEITDFKESEYKLGEEHVNSYEIQVSISYEKEDGYDSKIKIILVKEDKKISIVEFEPTKED